MRKVPKIALKDRIKNDSTESLVALNSELDKKIAKLEQRQTSEQVDSLIKNEMERTANLELEVQKQNEALERNALIFEDCDEALEYLRGISLTVWMFKEDIGVVEQRKGDSTRIRLKQTKLRKEESVYSMLLDFAVYLSSAMSKGFRGFKPLEHAEIEALKKAGATEQVARHKKAVDLIQSQGKEYFILSR